MLGNEDGLGHQNGDQQGHGGQAQAKHLDVENQEAAPRSLAKGSPRVGDGGVALAANDLGLDLALEGAVKGDNGALLDGQEGGLDADEDNVGGDDDEDGRGNGDDGDDEGLGEEAGAEGVHVEGLVEAALGHRDAEDEGHDDGDEARDLAGEPENRDGLPGGFEGAPEGRQAGPKGQRRRLGNDDVNPGGAVLDQGQGGEESGDGEEVAAKGAGEDAHEEGGQEDLGEVAEEAAKVGRDAAVGHEEAVDGAEGRRDGARAAVGGLEAVARDALFAAGRWLIERDGLVGGRVLIFYHGKDGVDQLEGVLELLRRFGSEHDGPRLVATAMLQSGIDGAVQKRSTRLMDYSQSQLTRRKTGIRAKISTRKTSSAHEGSS